LSPRHFNSEVCRELFTLLIEHVYAEHFDLMAELSSSSAETRRVAAMLIAENKFSGTEFEAEKIAQDLIISLYRRAFEQQRREKEAKRRTATGDEAKSIEMDIMELTLNQHTLRSGWAKAKPMLDILISMAE
jgi:hypothetical protein